MFGWPLWDGCRTRRHTLGWLGVEIEEAANELGRGCISPAGRSPSVWVIPTDEERVIAAGTWAAVREASGVARPASSAGS
jgi:acetate kinase